MSGNKVKQWVLKKTKSKSADAHAAAAAATADTGAKKDKGKEKDKGKGSGTAEKADIPKMHRPKTEWMAKGHIFRVDSRFSFIKVLGVGAYGVVCSAMDSITGTKVAIKKVNGLFDDIVDAKRILREVRLLRSMNHEHILSIFNLDEPEDYDNFNELYIVMPLLETDLVKLLQSSIVLQEAQRVFLVYQMLKAAKYLAVGNILHRDLKPANIVINSNCDLKIVDFGLARAFDPGADEVKTEYVVTRWYRAPELLLSNKNYWHAVDMWAIGLITAELYSRQPLLKGRDTKNQLELMYGIVNDPTEEFDWVTNESARKFLQNLQKQRVNGGNGNNNNIHRRTLREMCGKECTDVAFDFIQKCLAFNPSKRLTPQQALEHPYVAAYRDPTTETVPVEGSLKPLWLEPPSEKVLGIAGIRRLIWNEILRYHPDAAAREPATASAAKAHVDGIEKQREDDAENAAMQDAALTNLASNLN